MQGYSEDKWLNVTILEVVDKAINNDVFRVSLISNSKDLESFMTPVLNFSISQDYKNCCFTTKFSELVELTIRMQELFKKENSINEFVYSSREKIIEIKKAQSNMFQVIITSSNSTGSVLIKNHIFAYILKQLIYIRDNWTSIILSVSSPQIPVMLNHHINMLNDNLISIDKRIRNLSDSLSMINFSPNCSQSYEGKTIIQEEAIPDSFSVSGNDINNELNNFVGSDFENINMDFTAVEKAFEKENSVVNIWWEDSFISNSLKNNISNYEDVLNSLLAYKNPQKGIIELIGEHSNLDTFDKMLPDASEDDIKSINYITNLLFKIKYLKFLSGDNSVLDLPIAPIFYKRERYEQNELLEYICLDLLIINSYLCLYKDSTSGLTDIEDNKKMIYFLSRTFTDCICYSYITSMNLDKIKNKTNERIEQLFDLSFFASYQNKLEEFKCPIISKEKLKAKVDFFVNRSINNPSVKERHESMFSKGSFKIPYLNKLTMDEIDYVWRIEAVKNVGVDITNKEELAKRGITDIPDNVFEVFNSNKTKSPASKNFSPLYKVLKGMAPGSIPTSDLENILNEVKYSEDKIDFDEYSKKYNFIDFSTEALIAIKLWEPNKYKSYNEFVQEVFSSSLTKSDILSIITNDYVSDNNGTETNDWDNVSWEF